MAASFVNNANAATINNVASGSVAVVGADCCRTGQVFSNIILDAANNRSNYLVFDLSSLASQLAGQDARSATLTLTQPGFYGSADPTETFTLWDFTGDVTALKGYGFTNPPNAADAAAIREDLRSGIIPTRRLGDSRDPRIGSGVIQDGKRRVFAMGQAVPVRTDYTAGEVRRFARRAKDGAQARRLLALAAVLDGASREEAAKIGGMDRQTLRDWVIRYNEQGPDGLINIPSPGAPPKLDDTQKAFLRRIVEEGPIPAIHGVVRWRACDLIMRLHDEFGLSVSDDTIYRALKDLGFSHVSARPKAYKQDADAMAAFKKTLPYAWRKSARHSRLARQ